MVTDDRPVNTMKGLKQVELRWWWVLVEFALWTVFRPSVGVVRI